MAKRPCSGKTKTGEACGAPAVKGSDRCYMHEDPARARTLGRIGGSKNRAQPHEPPAAGSLSAANLRDILAETIYEVRAQKVSPRVAGALAQLCNTAHRILQTADLEARLARLEQQLAEQGRRTMDEIKPHGQDEAHGETNALPDNAHTPDDAGDSSDGSKSEQA